MPMLPHTFKVASPGEGKEDSGEKQAGEPACPDESRQSNLRSRDAEPSGKDCQRLA